MEDREQKQEAGEVVLHEAVMAKLSPLSDPDDAGVLAVIDEVLLEYSRRKRLSVAERAQYRKRLFDSFRRLDVLQDLLEDERVTEIMVNGFSHIFLERGGKVTRWPGGFSSTEKLEDVIQQIVSRVNRVVNISSPIVDARLEDGSRVNVVLPPVAPDGPILTIRKFPKEPVTMEKLLAWGSITEEAAEFLRHLVEAGYNIFVSGGTSSGKTTFLNALSRYIPADERVITIEDSLELQLSSIPNLVRLETRNESVGGAEAIRIRDLIRSALRMRPDRLVIGEVRGAEALDLLQAFNTGHDGSMSTAHANSPADMLSRLETMVLMGGDLPLPAVRQQIASAIEILVHLGRRRGVRKVLSIVEVLRVEKGEIVWQPLFSRRRTEAGDGFFPEGRPLVRAQKAMDFGGKELCHRLSQLLAVPEGVDPLWSGGNPACGRSGGALLPEPSGLFPSAASGGGASAADARKTEGETPG